MAMGTDVEPRPWWKRRWVIATAGAVAVLAVIGNLTDDPVDEEPAGQPEPAAQPQGDLEVEESPGQEPEEPPPAPEPEPSPDPEPEPEQEPDSEQRPTTLEADLSEGPSGLRIVVEEDVYDCEVDLNPGIVRSGYTTTLVMLTAGEPYVIPWGDLTDRNGDRFNYQTQRPEMVTVSCSAEVDDRHVYDTWSW